MATVERPAERGRRIGETALVRLGEELRRARVAAGLSLRELGRIVHMDHGKISRIERGRYPAVTFGELAALMAVVGLRLHVAAFPSGTLHRDRGHARLVDRFAGLLHPSWDWRTEVPLPNPVDPRSWDGLLRGAGVGEPDRTLRVGVECETGPRDRQELQRKLATKLRDGSVDELILVLSDTRANRAFLLDYKAQLATAFPQAPPMLTRALREGRDPGGSGILIL